MISHGEFTFADLMEEATPYIRQVLNDFHEALSESITIISYLRNLVLENGYVVPYALSRYLHDEEMAKYASRKYPTIYNEDSAWRKARSQENALVPFIVDYLQQNGRYVVLQDFYARAWHPLEGLQERLHLFVYGPYVYPFLGPYESNPQKVNVTIGGTHPTVGILTSLPEQVPPIQDGQIIQDAAILATLAERTTHILIEAFDGCGFLLWHKSSN